MTKHAKLNENVTSTVGPISNSKTEKSEKLGFFEYVPPGGSKWD